MKKIFTLSALVLLFVSTLSTVFSQKTYVNYDSDSRWFWGANLGGTWHTSDIDNVLNLGGGLVLGRSFRKDRARIFSYDLRFRWLRADFEGSNSSITEDVSEVPYLNGTMYPLIDYTNTSGAKMNFYSEQNNLDLELVINTNRLRERTGWNFSIFGGLGFNHLNLKGNFVDSENNIYDFTESTGTNYAVNLPKNSSEIEGGLNVKNWNFMPSLGAGISYQVGPAVSLGIEHKTLFTLSDHLDGNAYVNLNSQNDWLHYTSFSIQFYMGAAGKTSNKPVDNDTPTNVVKPNNTNVNSYTTTKRPPKILINNPSNNNYVSENSSFNLQAEITNMSSAQGITFKQNGNRNYNFVYNSSSNQFTSTIELNPGSNLIEINATNEDGSDYQSTYIIYKETEEIKPPIVSIIDPNNSPHTTQSAGKNVIATILNVDNSSNVTFTVNGTNFTNFNFNENNHSFDAHINLKEGNNIITLKGTNSAGSDQKTVTIVYDRPQEKQPPIVSFINPTSSPKFVQQNSYNLSASVQNVDSKNDITFTLNGQTTNNFVFNANNEVLNANLPLVNGANVITIKATNSVGQDSKSTTILVQQPNLPEPPLVNFINPIINPTTVFNENITIKAKVLNVAGKSNINVKINGTNTSNFNYSTSSKILTFNDVLLEGANIFEITGTNNAGNDSKSTTVIYKKPIQGNPPVVNINYPSVSPFYVTSQHFDLNATVLNVNGKQQISVTSNGTTTNLFTYNTQSKNLEYSLNLNEGQNNIKIYASNAYGNDQKTVTIHYKKPQVATPPVISWIDPSNGQTSTYASSYNIKAKIEHISNKNQISINANGSNLPSYMYSWNGNTKEVQFSQNLNFGNNIIQISATNNDGSDSKTANIKRENEPCDKPTISFQSPSNVNTTVQNQQLNLSAVIQNVSQIQQVGIKLNGVLQNNINFNSTNNTVSANVSLNPGNNTVEYTANNNCGSVSKTLFVQYVPQEAPCQTPTAGALQPSGQQATYQSQQVQIKGKVTNANTNQITVLLNSSSINFNYDQATHILTANVNLNVGINNLAVKVSTDCGKAGYVQKLIREECHQPQISMVNPTGNSITVNDNNYNVKAIIDDIDHQNNIQFTQNGSNKNFVYNSVNHNFNSNVTLNQGNNSFVIKATNNCGKTDQKTFNIKYEVIVVPDPPVVTVTNPTANPHTTNQSSITIQAQIQNVNSSNNVSYQSNGNNISGFQFNANTGSFSVQKTLQPGSNVFTITGTNGAGSDSKTQTIIYEPPVTINPPVVTFTSPTSSPKNIAAKNAQINGKVTNIDAGNQVQISVNGQSFTGYGSSINNGLFNFSFSLPFSTATPQYVISVTGTNQAGSDQESVTVIYDLGSNPMDTPGGDGGSYSGGNNSGEVDSGDNDTGDNDENNSGGNNGNGQGNSNNSNKMTICHYPPGNTGNPQTIEISPNAWPAHEAHGDTQGECGTTNNGGGNNNQGGNNGGNGSGSNNDGSGNTSGCMPSVSGSFATNHQSATANSTKDLSNVVLKFNDGSTQKFEGLSGNSGNFSGTGGNAGKCIVGMWIKSGCNQSGDGPGYGEYVSNSSWDGNCANASGSGGTSGGGNDSGGNSGGNQGGGQGGNQDGNPNQQNMPGNGNGNGQGGREVDDNNQQKEAERKAQQEAQRKAQEEAKRKAQQEAKRKAQQEAQRKAQEEAKRKAQQEAQRKAQEEAKRKAQEEAQRKAQEEAKRKAQQEAQRKAQEEAKRKTQQEAQRKAQEEAKRKAQQEAKKRAEEERKKKEQQKKSREIKNSPTRSQPSNTKEEEGGSSNRNVRRGGG